MSQVSRPLLGVLAATVLLFAVWTVALKPGAKSQTTTAAPVVVHHSAIARPAPRTPVDHASPTQVRLDAVAAALKAHKVIALLFYNPPAADDRAVKQELAAVPAHAGRVFKLAVPLTDLTRYPVVTDHITVSSSPTLVVIDRRARASMIVGFTDRFEIAQRIDEAVAVK